MSVWVPAAQDLHATADAPKMKRVAALFAVLAFAGCGGEEPPVDPTTRAATFRWDTTVTDKDKRWIQAAIDEARPEARQLIDDIDGMVIVGTYAEPGAPEVGMMRPLGEHQYQVVFNLAYLNGDRKIDRTTTVLHELGHVIDARGRPGGAARRARRPASLHRQLRHPRARRLHRTGGAVRRHVRQVGAARRRVRRRRRLRGGDPRLARGLGDAAGEPRDRDPGQRFTRSVFLTFVVSVPCLSVTVVV